MWIALEVVSPLCKGHGQIVSLVGQLKHITRRWQACLDRVRIRQEMNVVDTNFHYEPYDIALLCLDLFGLEVVPCCIGVELDLDRVAGGLERSRGRLFVLLSSFFSFRRFFLFG